MLKLSKIFLPVEFHETSLRIIGTVDFIARRFHSEIVLLHVIAPESYSSREWKADRWLSSDDLLAELRAYAESELHEPMGSVFAGLPLKSAVQRGDPTTTIIDLAKQEETDLIAMPTRGRKGFYGHLVGSVTANVIYGAEQPVLTGMHFCETLPSMQSCRNPRFQS